jgi:hypothetical protein
MKQDRIMVFERGEFLGQSARKGHVLSKMRKNKRDNLKKLYIFTANTLTV